MSSQPRRPLPIDRQETYLRRAELKTNPKNVHPAPWMFKAAGLGQLVMVPVIVGYFMFVVDYGDQEHVFSEPRRWLQRQKEAFLSVPPNRTDPAPTPSIPSQPSS